MVRISHTLAADSTIGIFIKIDLSCMGLIALLNVFLGRNESYSIVAFLHGFSTGLFDAHSHFANRFGDQMAAYGVRTVWG